MDWEKVKKLANLCTIGAFFVAVAALVVALVWFGYTVWIQPAVSVPGQPLPIWELPPMKAWLPALIIGIGLVLAAIFNLIAAFMSRRTLKKQLVTANAAFADISEKNESLTRDLAAANREWRDWERKYHAANNATIPVASERDSYKDQVSELTLDLETNKLQLLNERMALRAKEDELGQATEDLKQASKRADDAETENLRLANELARSTPNKRLIAITNNDATEIQDVVTVRGIKFRNETEHGKRYVDFVFSIFNQSLYEITIDDEVGDGDIVFNGEPFVTEKRIHDNNAKLVPIRTSGYFTVRQHLNSAEIKDLKEASGDRAFRLDNLKIKIKGGPDFEGVIQEKRLKVEYVSLSKQSPEWLNYNGPFLSRFDGEVSGKINAVYFQHRFDVGNHAPGQDNQYDFYFVLHTFIANHGAPTGIERFRLVLKANNQAYEGRRLPLTECRWIKPGAEETLSDRDVEDHNDVTLSDTRRGWLQFVVPGVKRYDEDHPTLELELDVIDKEGTPNRLIPLPQDEWIENSMNQGSYINGPGIWQQF